MVEASVRQGPLIGIDSAAAGAGNDAARIEEIPFRGYFNLRGNPAPGAFAEVVRNVVGLGLPIQPGTAADAEGIAALWLGPDEWLLVTPDEEASELIEVLRGALAGEFAALNDISSALTTIRVSGSHARDLVAKGCTLDLHPRVFAAGACAQSLVARSDALIHAVAGSVLDIIVRRSFADYLWRWLDDAAIEFG